MKTLKFLSLLAALMIATGCATTETQDGAGDDATQAGEGVDATANGGIGEPEAMEADPLEDPESPLNDRIVYFEFDRSDIPAEHLATLDAHARYLIENPDVKIRLEGHADERGSREYNIGLGDRRAQAVRRILLFQGVANDQVSTVSYGEERPAVEGHTDEAYAQNRRVEIVYVR
ncbi:MAG TPA: peptidoglycan-associated lipoprotein Pal [Gammaproteobacteria bacterium]